MGSIQSQLTANLSIGDGLAAFYKGSDSRRGIRVRRLYRSPFWPAIRGFGSWPGCLVYPSNQREEYEENLQKQGLANARICQFDDQGQMEPAGQRDEYFPLTFIVSVGQPICSIGVSTWPRVCSFARLSSKPAESGDLVGVGGFRLDEDLNKAKGEVEDKDPHQDQPSGVFIFVPIYEKGVSLDTADQRREHLEGCILAVLELAEIVDSVAGFVESAGFGVQMFDSSPADRGEAGLRASPSRPKVR